MRDSIIVERSTVTATPMKKSARSGTRGYASLVEIDAPPARVWRALVEPALIRVWSGAPADVDPRKGGLYRTGADRQAREAHIDVFDVNRRLRLIYLRDPTLPPCDSAIVDDFLLDLRNGPGKTSLRLLGSGIPEAADWDSFYKRARLGWERQLARIKVALENPPGARGRPAPPARERLRGLDY
jgi:uncharacterized protein YndB with AHSA1/START domain